MPAAPHLDISITPANSSQFVTALGIMGIGLLFCLAGGIATTPQILMLCLGLLFLLTGSGVALSDQSFTLDKAGKRYRHVTWVLGFSYGDWHELPPVSGILVKYFSQYPVGVKRRWQVNTPDEYYIVLLSTPATGRQGIVVDRFPFRQKHQASRLAQELSAYLTVSVQVYEPT